jgi:hypothetical protein
MRRGLLHDVLPDHDLQMHCLNPPMSVEKRGLKPQYEAVEVNSPTRLVLSASSEVHDN